MKKPIAVRAIFIMYAVKILFATTLYLVFTLTDVESPIGDPIKILYELGAYIALFAVMIWSIYNKKIWVLRGAIVLDVLVSIPVKAYVAFLFGAISIVLTFSSKKLKAFFDA